MKEQCEHCKLFGHTQRNHSECLFNTKIMKKAQHETGGAGVGARKNGKCATFELLCTHKRFPVLTSMYTIHGMESCQTRQTRTPKILTIRQPKKMRFLNN